MKSLTHIVGEQEEVLINQCIEWDKRAQNMLYKQFSSKMFSVCFRYARNREEAEDILQEVFITLWEKRKTISLEQSVGGWLFVLCYNKSVNLLRKKLRESSAYQILKEPITDDIVDEMKYNLQWQILENAMAQLSPQKRKVFELCKIQGKTYEETASALQISKYTVKEYLSSAVSFVKEYIHHHPQSSVAVNTGFFVFLFANS